MLVANKRRQDRGALHSILGGVAVYSLSAWGVFSACERWALGPGSQAVLLWLCGVAFMVAGVLYVWRRFNCSRPAGSSDDVEASFSRGEDLSEAICHGMAKGPWSVEWARSEVEKGLPASESEAYEMAPPPPDEVTSRATILAAKILRLNNKKRLEQLWRIAVEHGFLGSPVRFGSLLGLQAAGYAARWWDRLPAWCEELIVVPPEKLCSSPVR